MGDDEEMIKVAAGDLILFAKYAGTELKLDGDDYLILDAADLLALHQQTRGQGRLRRRVMNVVKVMNAAAGRSARVVAGLALIGTGLATGGTGGLVLAVTGAIVLLAGVAGICLAAPLLRAPLRAR